MGCKSFVLNQKNSFLMLAVGQTLAKVRRMFKAAKANLRLHRAGLRPVRTLLA
jgi:hypothetical protein